MKNKKVLKLRTKIILILEQQVAFVMAVVLLCTFIGNCEIKVQFANTEANQYNYEVFYVDPFDKKADFEDTDIFNSMLCYSIQEVVRLAVIQSQLETNGTFYGRKAIDIVSYANRKNSDENIEGQRKDLVAKYFLEDLLKWDKYGIEYTEYPVQIYDYSSETMFDDSVTVTDSSDEDATESAYSVEENEEELYINANEDFLSAPIDYYTPYAVFNYIEENEDTDGLGTRSGTVSMLKNRYSTINAWKLEQVADNWEEYFQLVHDLDLAVTNLSINYADYQEYEKIYGPDKSNLKYCLCMNVDGNQVYISNLNEINSNSDITQKEIEKIFNSYEKNIYYYPENITYNTNTEVDEDLLFDALCGYEYAYSDTSKVWIGVDTSYPVTTDQFANAANSYANISPYMEEMVAGIIICIFIYFAILIYLSYFAGRQREENQVIIKLNGLDRLPTEFVLVMSGGLCYLGIYSFVYLVGHISSNTDLIFIDIVMGVYTFIASSIFLTFFYSLIRRIKGHNLWRDSWIWHLLDFAAKTWKKNAKVIASMPNPFIRVWIPYLAFLIGNLVAVLFGIYLFFGVKAFLGFFCVAAAFVADMVIGFYRMRDDGERHEIIKSINRIRGGEVNYQVEESMHGDNVILAEAVNNIGEGIRKAVETSMKDERLKADLITNVSHDIKTPLTSIINYVDLLKREHIEDEKIQGYITVLDSKSQRLKQLTEDLVEASKISSGNISYIFEKINLTELLKQAVGEFSEKFESKGLEVIDNLDGKEAVIEADSRRMWRIIENLFNNIFKYAMPNTRVYLNMEEAENRVSLSIKNISAQPLNISAGELTERFIRGDISRSTEGSGLGLSIAKSLTEAQHGNFDIYLDGDLFKIILSFQLIVTEEDN